jgi:hypothetical protein
MMLATLSTLSIFVHAQESAPNPFKDIQFSGFLDIYYQYSGNNPSSGKLLPFRNFDVRDNSFSIAAAFVSLSKAATKQNPFGFTVNLLGGKDADIETAGEPNDPNGLKYLHQAYVTYLAPDGMTVDLGKFQTWIGLESPFAVNNDLYSLSFVFTLGQPIYHAGLRVTKPIGATTLGLYLVNGINEAEDANRSKSYGASLAHTFGKVSATLNYYGGNEGSNTGPNGPFNVGQSNWQLGDLVLSTQLTPALKLSANADYASIHALDPGASNGHYASYDVIARYQFTKSFSVSGRYDNFFDHDGARTGFGGGARLNSGVIGCEYLTGSQSSLRFEVRHDESNRHAFESDGAGGERSRTTFTLAHIYKF